MDEKLWNRLDSFLKTNVKKGQPYCEKIRMFTNEIGIDNNVDIIEELRPYFDRPDCFYGVKKKPYREIVISLDAID